MFSGKAIGFTWRSLCLTIFAICLSLGSTAQTTVIVADENGGPLPSAHITYVSQDDKTRGTVLTDVNGKADIPESFTSDNANFTIEIAYLGFEKKHESIIAGSVNNFSLREAEVSLNQVVVTGQYEANSPDKSINKVRIIDRKELDARGVVNLTDALQFENNVRLNQDSELGSSMSVQGISGQNVKIMIDGVPVIGRLDGNIDLNQINLNNIERIEIIDGPLSVNYGTNALGGTINLISKKDQTEKYQLGANTYYETVGQYNIDGRLGYNQGAHQVSVSGGRNFFDGWSEGESFQLVPQSSPADSNRNQQWNPKEQYFANAQYVVTVKENSMRLFGDYFSELITDRGTPNSQNGETAFDQYFKTNRYNAGTDFGLAFGRNYHVKLLASYNYYERIKNSYFKDLTTLDEVLSPNPTGHDTTVFNNFMSRGSVVYLPKENALSFELGYDLYNETAFGNRIEGKEQNMGDYAAYGSLEWTIYEKFTLKPGLRYAYNTKYDAPLVPSLNLKYAAGKMTYRASYARGFRAPSLKELYLDFTDINHDIVGNPDLKAETSDNLQFDATYKWLRKQKISNINAGVFYNQINDMITLAQTGSALEYSYVNIAEFRSQGAEISMENAYNHFKTSAGIVVTGRQAAVSNEPAPPMKYSPEVRMSVMYEFKKLGGNVSLFYKYNGKLPLYNVSETGEITESTIDEYHMLDFTAAKYLWNKKISLTCGVKNILDVTNVNSSGASGGTHSVSAGSTPVSWGRSFFIGLKFNAGWQ